MPTRRDLDRIVPLSGPTDESIDYHRAQANAERARLNIPPFPADLFTKDLADIRILAQCSVRVAEPIRPSSLDALKRDALMNALDELVERFGVWPVCRAVQAPEGVPLLDGPICKLLNMYGYVEVWRSARLVLAANGIEA